MALVTILAGSSSDRHVVDPAIEILRKFGIPAELYVASAHKDPDRVVRIVKDAEKNGTCVFIAAAGMAAHLAGLVAAHTVKPVIGLPVGSGPLKGQDSLLSIAMMPPGIPVATVGIDNGKNAALLALQILALIPEQSGIAGKLCDHRDAMRKELLSAQETWLEELTR